MSKKVVIPLLLLAISAAASAITLSRLDDEQRQKLYIWINDNSRSLGLGIRNRDLKHMQSMTSLTDVSNVRCRDCHGINTDSLPWNQPHPKHPAPAGLAIHPDGSKLYAATPQTSEILEINTQSLAVLRRLAIPGHPTSLTLNTQGTMLYATLQQADSVAAIQLDSFTEAKRAYVGLLPSAIAYATTPNGPQLVIANSASDNVSILNADTLDEITRLNSGREPHAVAINTEGSRAIIACRLAHIPKLDQPPHSEVTVVDLTRNRVLQRHNLNSAHLSEGTAFVPGQPYTLTPLVRVRNLVPITQVARGWVMSSGIALIQPDQASPVLQIPTDEANRFFADPSGIVVHPQGHQAYLAHGGSDCISVIDLHKLNSWIQSATPYQLEQAIHNLELAPTYVLKRIPTRRNPQQLTLSPDGSSLFVSEFLNDSILVINTSTLEPSGRITLASNGDDDPVRRGQKMFTTASRTFQGQFSCRSCHPGGHVDGLTYDFDGDGIGDNRLDNRSLQGLAGTWPFKWNGKNPSLSVQCGPRFAKVLMRTDPFSEAELQDLSAFIESMPPARTIHASRANQPLTPAQERGRATFFATKTPSGKDIPRERQCSTCHLPPLYTNRQKSAIGTAAISDASDEFDTPHLLGIAASAPYLHDGRAKTLEELWTIYQTNDLHGVSSYMNKQQLNDLVEFLKTL